MSRAEIQPGHAFGGFKKSALRPIQKFLGMVYAIRTP
jgi:hypothetical protein